MPDDLNDDDLIDLLGDIAGSYPPGVLPGLHPIEIITGARYGFDPGPAQAILDDPTLMLTLHNEWTAHEPSAAVIAIADGTSIIASLHRQLLERHHELAQVTELTQEGEAEDGGNAE